MFDLFEIQFKAVGDVRLNSIPLKKGYLNQFVKIMTLVEKAYSFDNLSHLLGRELAKQKTSLLSNEDSLQCSLDAFEIVESLNKRFNYDFINID
jgi:hypothetical protein